MENFFQWRQEWVLDLKEIDEQHRMLVTAVNELSPLYLKLTKNPKDHNATREQLTGKLKLLYGDLERHFRDEEKLMLEVAYPQHRSHAHAHVMLLAELKNYCNRVTRRDEDLDMGTLYSLRTWFVTHMLDDREFAAHFHAYRREDRYGTGEPGVRP